MTRIDRPSRELASTVTSRYVIGPERDARGEARVSVRAVLHLFPRARAAAPSTEKAPRRCALNPVQERIRRSASRCVFILMRPLTYGTTVNRHTAINYEGLCHPVTRIP